jgi:hypothetical protein
MIAGIEMAALEDFGEASAACSPGPTFTNESVGHLPDMVQRSRGLQQNPTNCAQPRRALTPMANAHYALCRRRRQAELRCIRIVQLLNQRTL